MKIISKITLLTILVCFVSLVSNARTYKYTGKIGPYPVKVSLTELNYESRQGFGTITYYSGKYTYTQAGNSLNLKGSDWTLTGYTTLDEYTPKGKHSGEWELEGLVGDDVLHGTFINLTNKKRFSVYLKLTSR